MFPAHLTARVLVDGQLLLPCLPITLVEKAEAGSRTRYFCEGLGSSVLPGLRLSEVLALEVVAEGVLEVRMRSSEGRALGAAEVEELQRLVQRGQQGAGEQGVQQMEVEGAQVQVQEQQEQQQGQEQAEQQWPGEHHEHQQQEQAQQEQQEGADVHGHLPPPALPQIRTQLPPGLPQHSKAGHMPPRSGSTTAAPSLAGSKRSAADASGLAALQQGSSKQPRLEAGTPLASYLLTSSGLRIPLDKGCELFGHMVLPSRVHVALLVNGQEAQELLTGTVARLSAAGADVDRGARSGQPAYYQISCLSASLAGFTYLQVESVMCDEADDLVTVSLRAQPEEGGMEQRHPLLLMQPLPVLQLCADRVGIPPAMLRGRQLPGAVPRDISMKLVSSCAVLTAVLIAVVCLGACWPSAHMAAVPTGELSPLLLLLLLLLLLPAGAHQLLHSCHLSSTTQQPLLLP